MADHTGITSKASIFEHPLHPMVIVFPIAFLVGALATDLAYWATDDTFWARFSVWLIGAGLVTGVTAAVLGLIDFLGIRQVRSHTIAWIHFLGNAGVLVISLVNLLIRLDDYADPVLPSGLMLSALTTAILMVTGWLGGELSYRHRIGVIQTE